MAKRKSRKKKSSHSPLFYINIFIGVLFVIFVVFIFISLNKDNSNYIEQSTQILDEQPMVDEKIIHQRFEEKTKALEIEYVDDDIIEETPVVTNPKPIFKFLDKTENKKVSKKIAHEKQIEKIKTNITQPKITIKKDTRAKLVIIIDDVTLQRQVDKITHIGYPVTMSFLPPTKIHKNSAKIAKPFDIYMIHLPTEAGSRRYEETNTLHIGDSLEKIDKRVKEVKKLYPKAKYLNNHTGSKFTADYTSMDRLMRALKKYDFYFVDSRTTAKTKGRVTAKKYGVKYLSRNIFLDNKQDRYYIRRQLKKAVNIAKKRGYAIAIGHPHPITLKTLKESKDLLKGLNLVYINEL